MLNFTVGPVMSTQETLDIASRQTPYFRTAEFSDIMLQNEQFMLRFLNAPVGSRCVFLTASGTGAMESCVMNILDSRKDKAIVINGGSFGQRFLDLCNLHHIETVEIPCDFGEAVTLQQLEDADTSECTALLVNMDETSSGVLSDVNMLSEFCKKNNLILIIDAISSFLSDDIDMERLGAAAIITGSQKALAVQPGISIIVLNPVAIKRIEENEEKCLYLSLKEALKNMERGQTPFTPAVSILLQINARLRRIDADGGVIEEKKKICSGTEYFRQHISDPPFDFVVKDIKARSNAVTALYSGSYDATKIFQLLKDKYGIWICPNGGKYKNIVLRVGHIGNIKLQDYDTLLLAIKEVCKEIDETKNN